MKKLLQRFFIIVILFQATTAYGKIYYVATTGSDSNDGSFENPVETIQKAQELVSAGDTVYIRGGNYSMRTDQIDRYYSIWVYVTQLNKSGTADQPISYLAYPDETPVFDYSNIKPSDYRITAFYINGSYIHIKGIEVTGVQVTITTHTQSECFEIQGSNNTLEQIKMHDGMAIGVYILKGSNNLILNCDAYNNWDSVSENGLGGNTDGFGCHVSAGSTGNVFRGCRAWFNSDDGFDCISAHEATTFDHCWAFYNGYSSNFASLGDGNGFKAGGYGTTAFSKLPDNIPSNTVKFCLAVKNKANGFYSNHHLNGSKWYNNTAYKNSVNYNMLNRKAKNETDYLTDVDGYDHTMYNNLGYGATSKELSNIDTSACTLSNNYFYMKNIVVNNNDFVSTDLALLTADRESDGGLPENDFLRLAEGSDLIDKGKDIGFDYYGDAPDLGCFESNYTNSSIDDISASNKFACYPNPFSDKTTIAFTLTKENNVRIELYDLTGKRVKVVCNQTYSAGDHEITLYRGSMQSGMYLLREIIGNTCHTYKLIVK